MPLELKSVGIRGPARQEALRRRAKDEPLRSFTSSEVDDRVAAIARRPVFFTEPLVAPGQPLDSKSWREFLKDSRMYASMLVAETDVLEKEIRRASKSFFSSLDDLQRETAALTALVNEDEVRGYSGYGVVHYNQWIRTQDQPLDYEAGGWLIDFKSGSTFLPSNIAEVIPGVGLALPVASRTPSLISNITLLAEETDYGDSRRPLITGNPMDLIDPTKVFRHVIVRREHDDTSRPYSQGPAYMTLLVELSGRQTVNYLELRPLGHSVVNVDEVSYYDESGTESALSFEESQSGLFTTLIFEPVRTRFLKIKFVQNSPVAKTTVYVEDPRVAELNEILRGQGFSQLLEEDSESIQGRVHDFSLEKLAVGLNQYVSLGVYRSGDIKVSDPVGLDFVYRSTDIKISSASPGEPDRPMLDDAAFPEFYLGMKLEKDGVKVVDSLIPVPNTNGYEEERLVLIGKDARLRFCPDFSFPKPLSVYKNITPLAIGTDFKVSVDRGSTYLDNWTDVETQFNIRRLFLVAGDVIVRILNPDRSAFYNAEYSPYGNQLVTATGFVRLVNGRLRLTNDLIGTNGTVQTVCVIRSLSNNPYVTPLINWYLLKVREYVA